MLTAVFAAHLHRETGAPEVVLGLPVMNRLGTAALRVPAMVRNVIPLRIAVTPVDTPRQLAARTAAEIRACLPHQRTHHHRAHTIANDLLCSAQLTKGGGNGSRT